MSKLLESKMPCPWCPSSDGYHEYETNFHCFSCHKSKAKPKEENSRSLFIDKDVVSGVMHTGRISLPKTVTKDFPKEAMKWLLEAGITKALIDQYDIHYVENEIVPIPNTNRSVQLSKRIILPYITSGEVKFYQARSLNICEPRKYITIGPKSAYRTGPTSWVPDRVVVVVEDILSAIRVAEVTEAVALIGTSLDDETALHLANYKEVKVWMDNDAPGIAASNKIVKKLKLYCKKVVQIKHNKDTKRCFQKELEQMLRTST